MKRFETLFSARDMARVTVNEAGGFCVDLHGMSCQQATRFLKNLVALIKYACEITVIHGYCHGQALKDIVRRGNFSKKIAKTESVAWNPGITKLVIA